MNTGDKKTQLAFFWKVDLSMQINKGFDTASH